MAPPSPKRQRQTRTTTTTTTSQTHNHHPLFSQRVSRVARSVQQTTTSILLDVRSELTRLHNSNTSLRTLLHTEVQRALDQNKRILLFPQAPTLWDCFFLGLLVIFVVSVLPGITLFVQRTFPQYWTLFQNQSVYFENMDLHMNLYKTACYGIVTPLSKPMPFYFVWHVVAGSTASFLLLLLFTTGRVMRWRLADGTLDYDAAHDLHKLLALASTVCWTTIIVTGGSTIPLLHPTLQVANYAELVGVSTLFVGTLLTAYLRQWVFHRLLAWGLIYSAVASVFVLITGRSLQALTNWSAYDIKAIGYTVAFATPIFGLARDVVKEASKVGQDKEQVVLELAQKHNLVLTQSKIRPIQKARPFQAARGDQLRTLSLWQHIVQVEPLEEHQSRRYSSIVVPSSTTTTTTTNSTASSNVKPSQPGHLTSSGLQELTKLYDESVEMVYKTE